MAVTRIEEGGLGTDSFNLPVTLNGTDGSSTHAGDNIVLDASASGVDAGERLLYEGIPPDSIDISNSISVLSGATLTIDSGATIVNSGTATGFGSNEPTSADGQALGSTSAEWSDLYLADGGVIYFGNDQEVKLTHSADSGIILKHTATADDKPINLVLQTGETDMAANDVMGKISFQAPDEGAGTDAILVAGAIQVVSEGDFSSSNNAATMEFHTAASEAAAVKAKLTSTGLFQVGGGAVGGPGLSFTADTDTGWFRTGAGVMTSSNNNFATLQLSYGRAMLNETANGDQSYGMTLNQVTGDNEMLAVKSSDIAHGMTDHTETDTYGVVRKFSSTGGGFCIEGYTEDTAGFAVESGYVTGSTTKGSSGRAAIEMRGYLKSGTAIGNTGANQNMFMVNADGDVTGFLVDSDGDLHYDGSTSAFDEYDDGMMLRTFMHEQTPKGVIKTDFDKWVKYNKKSLEESGIIGTIDPDNPDHYHKDGTLSRPLVCLTQLQRLEVGAIVQQRAMFETMKSVVEEMLPGFSKKLNERLEAQSLPALPV